MTKTEIFNHLITVKKEQRVTWKSSSDLNVYQTLKEQGFLNEHVRRTKSNGSKIYAFDYIYEYTLSEKGHEFIREHQDEEDRSVHMKEELELQKEANEISKEANEIAIKANKRSTWAIIISIVAALAAIGSVLIAFVK